MERQVLYNTHGLLLLFTGAAVALLYRTVQTDTRDRSAWWIAATTGSGGIGLLLMTAHSHLAEVLGCCLFLLTPPLLHVSIGSAARESVRRTLPWVLGFAVAGYLAFAFSGSVMAALLPVPTVELATLWLLLHNRRSATRLANIAMAAFLLLHVVLFSSRIGIIIARGSYTGPLAYSGMFTVVGLGVSFIAMEALRSRHEFERMAMTDPLTGLLNRRGLDLVAPRELLRCVRLGKPCSALMLDIDQFKKINDSMGHAAGDASLRAIAGVLQSLLRPNDVVTRHGGDEFFVLLPECDEAGAQFVTARLRQAIKACSLQAMGGAMFRLHVSIGVTTSSGSAMTVADLLHNSDIVLYREKQFPGLDDGHQAKDEVPGGGAQVQPSNA